VPISLKPSHLKRYKDIAVLLVKYGRGDLAKRLDVEGELPPGSATDVFEKPKADELTRDLERLGPTFVKVGQLLSTRADLLPVAYLAFTEIAQLLDRHAEAGRLYQFEKMVGEFRKTLLRELDYRQEAQNLSTLRENLQA
jgi:predicted unusual protein kinase regulating ubiquinone biosynthesis (AarF/ABC1/UbiB family)